MGKITVTGDLSEKQKTYIESTLGPVKYQSIYEFEDFESQFLRLAQDRKIRNTHPYAKYNNETSSYDLTVNVKSEKDLRATEP